MALVSSPTLKLGPLTPDAGEHNNPGLIDALGVVPYAGVYLPDYDRVELSDQLITTPGNNEIMGGMAAPMGDYLYQIYVGLSQRLYEYNSLSATLPWSFLNVTRKSGGYVVGDSGWHFTQLGTHVIACPGADWGNTTSAIQWLGDNASPSTYGDGANLDPTRMWPQGSFALEQATPTKEFQDMINPLTSSYVYKARFCGATDRRVIIAHLYDTNLGIKVGGSAGYLPYRVAWSKTDDPTEFHDDKYQGGVSLSDYQDLLDDWGPISGMSAGSDYTLIFKPKGIYRMIAGGPFQYSFQPVPNGLGCRWSHSIVRVGTDVYFWGPSGPCKYIGYEGRVVELGLGRIARTVLDDTWIAGTNVPKIDKSKEDYWMSAAHDTSTGVVVWNIPRPASDPEGKLLVYNYMTDQFSVLGGPGPSYFDQNYRYIFTRPDVDGDFTVCRDILYLHNAASDRRVLSGWAVTGGTSNEVSPTFTTGFVELVPGKRTCVQKVRVILGLNASETSAPTITVTVNSRQRPWDKPTDTVTGTLMDRRGWISVGKSATAPYHQFKIELGPTNVDRVADIDSFEVEYSVDGSR